MPDILMGRKASEVFLEYCKPFLSASAAEGRKDLKDVRRGLRFPHLIWNAFIMDELKGGPFTRIQNVRNSIKEAAHQGEAYLNFWIKRRKEEFGKYRYTIGDFHLYGKDIHDFVMRVDARDPTDTPHGG